MERPITPSGDDEQAKTVGEKITCICGHCGFYLSLIAKGPEKVRNRKKDRQKNGLAKKYG
jgi:hypothetical protein